MEEEEDVKKGDEKEEVARGMWRKCKRRRRCYGGERGGPCQGFGGEHVATDTIADSYAVVSFHFLRSRPST